MERPSKICEHYSTIYRENKIGLERDEGTKPGKEEGKIHDGKVTRSTINCLRMGNSIK